MPGIFVNRNPRHLAGNSSFLSGPSLAFFSGVCYSFGLGQTITRAQFVTVTARMLGWDTKTTTASGFTDTKGHWAEGAIPSGYADAVKQLQANGCQLSLSVSLWRLGNLPADSTDGLYSNVLSACQ